MTVEHQHTWEIDTKYPPESGILAECACGEVRLTVPSDIQLPAGLDPMLDGPGDLYPPNWS